MTFKKSGLAKRLNEAGLKGITLAFLPKEQREPKILLAPNIPYPLHEVAPRVVLGANWWNKERRAAYISTNFRCLACGVPKYLAEYHQWLEGHEEYQVDYAKGRMHYKRAVPLCYLCHSYIHSGRLEALLKYRQITQARYVAVIQHGSKVLAEAKLKKPAPYNGPFAPWGSWRLVIGKNEYPPKYKNQKEWELHFNALYS